MLSVSGPIRKGGGGGGGGGVQARIQNVLEGGAERLARKFLATTPILVFILETETEGVPKPPEPPPLNTPLRIQDFNEGLFLQTYSFAIVIPIYTVADFSI